MSHCKCGTACILTLLGTLAADVVHGYNTSITGIHYGLHPTADYATLNFPGFSFFSRNYNERGALFLKPISTNLPKCDYLNDAVSTIPDCSRDRTTPGKICSNTILSKNLYSQWWSDIEYKASFLLFLVVRKGHS